MLVASDQAAFAFLFVFFVQAGMICSVREYSSSGMIYTKIVLTCEHSVWGNDKEEKEWKY
jgi:hypothetical protein